MSSQYQESTGWTGTAGPSHQTEPETNIPVPHRTNRDGLRGPGGAVGHGRAGAPRITGARAILSSRLVVGATRGTYRGRGWRRGPHADDPTGASGPVPGDSTDLPGPAPQGPDDR